ncbi:Asp23/Gls24 family envelope stress response protein [Streptomyces sp. N50]|uniref:Asp23/Gls24 family envelope stress response protein n=1 Tax=Streptomyces sp. N50 TaxID=3081765 RepID=UPI0029621394|nr:Asp23/Gls24 family envelope stress response protein [Streptomyces sp. N50]WOX11205.1 Asp23/Gls24 family envelope stress response protein [Streptomyces sp. N50]
MTDRTDQPNTTAAASAAAPADDELLPCGRLLSRTWEDWERGADDPHLRTCPHCRQAVRGLDDLESVVRGLQAETDTAASAYDTEPLTRRIMDVVRLELRPGRPLPLGEPVEDLWIMEAVVARALRAAAESVPGVRAGSCRLREGGDGDGDGGTVEVRLEIHAPADAPLPELAARVRERVWEAADRELGMDITAVDIRVTDLVPASLSDDDDDEDDDDQEGGAA